MIYFDINKIAYGFEIPDPLATIDEETWRTYSDSLLGTDYDILDGVFTTFTSKEDLEKRSLDSVRESERKARYVEAENHIAKHDDFIFLGVDMGSHTQQKTMWMQYKMAVRETVNQPNYPYEVEYPEQPH